MAEIGSLSRPTKLKDTPFKSLVNPRVKPYYQDSFGSKSIGEPDWKPHPRNALSFEDAQDNSPMGGNGLDWVSSLRCPPVEEYHKVSPSQKPSTVKQTPSKQPTVTKEEIPVQQPTEQLRSTGDDITQTTGPLRQVQQHAADMDEDFEKIFRRRPLEMTLEMSLGAKMKVSNKRNGISSASLGDKTYQVPEYAKDFHKHGSTLPVVDFGGSLQCIPDTFVPLQDLPLRPSQTFEQKEKEKKKLQEISEVQDLDNWQPAKVLTPFLQLPQGTHA